MRSKGALPFEVPGTGRTKKLSFVELRGAGLTDRDRDLRFGIVCASRDSYCSRGSLNGRACRYRIDTGSDVSLISPELAGRARQTLAAADNLRYPTVEKVPVLFKTDARISLGKVTVQMPIFVAPIGDECILGANFLSRTGLLKGLLERGLGSSEDGAKGDGLACSRVEDRSAQLPPCLSEIFEHGSRTLDPRQKGIYRSLLSEFRDAFSSEIIDGNCEVVRHRIQLTDSPPIKQAPRRVPLHLREEVNGII